LSTGDRLFESFNGGCEITQLRLTHQHMNVLWHDNVTEDKEAVFHTDFFESLLEHLRCAMLH
jgi:hypothetical protein